MTDGSVASDARAATSTREPIASISTLGDRLDDLVLAGVHLRLGSLPLARAELEALAGREALDAEGLVDLAEARWRTGDLVGAGEAAQAALDDESGPVIALLIAAEAAAARGRPTDARRYAAAALTAAGPSIDRIFAGMPRSVVWPPDPAAPAPAPTTMFHAAPAAGEPAGRPRTANGPGTAGRAAGMPPPAAGTRAAAGAAAAASGAAAALGGAAAVGEADQAGAGAIIGDAAAADTSAALAASGTAGFWDLPIGESSAVGAERGMPSAEAELAGGRAALETGDTHEAAIRLALVLRLTPALAPAVLELVAGRGERELALVRGDAYRLVGRELDARRAYADAAHPRQGSIVGADPGPPADPGSPADPALTDAGPTDPAPAPTGPAPTSDPPTAEGDPA